MAKRVSSDPLALRPHLVDIAKFSALSQVSLSTLPWDQFGNAVNLQATFRDLLQGTFVDFTRTYSQLFESFQKESSLIVSLPPVTSKLPAVEYFMGVQVVDSITTKSYEDLELLKQKDAATHEVRDVTRARLEDLLDKLNSDFITLLQGARQSLESSNPDRARHLAVSLRELFAHVLQALAPDDSVRSWCNDPDYYDEKGRPTRRARLFYVSRALNQDPFSRFVEKDIDTLLEFLGLFQRSTHEPASEYSEIQLKIMLLRMESSLRFLLEIWAAS